MHGYNHVYSSKEGGINPFWNRSEFAGHSVEVQREKIRKGVAIMRGHGFNPMYFFAPSHTFDEKTLQVLVEESDIRIISDTIGRYPYKKRQFYFIPQITGHCAKMPVPGIYTFCYHPNTMTINGFAQLEAFLGKYNLFSFDDFRVQPYGPKCILDRFLSWSFFTYRKMRGLK